MSSITNFSPDGNISGDFSSSARRTVCGRDFSRSPAWFLGLTLIIVLGIVLAGRVNFVSWWRDSPSSHQAAIEVSQLPAGPFQTVFSGEIKQGAVGSYRVDMDPFYFLPAQLQEGEEGAAEETLHRLVLKSHGKTLLRENFGVRDCDVSGECPLTEIGHFNFRTASFDTLPDEIILELREEAIATFRPPSTEVPRLRLMSQEYQQGVLSLDWRVDSAAGLNYLVYLSNNDFQSRDGFAGRTLLVEESGIDRQIPLLRGSSLRYQPPGYLWGESEMAIFATDGFHTVALYSRPFRIESHSPGQSGRVSTCRCCQP